MRENIGNVAKLAGAILLAGLAGCSSGISGADATLAADEGSPGFLDRVSTQDTVCENDAYRGMLLLVDGEDKAKTFQDRVGALVAKGILPKDWDHDANRTITKGRLAYMVCQACKIRGGVVMSLTGPSQRYCLRELQYMKMIAAGTPLASVPGLEYVAVISRADVYGRTGKVPDIMEVSSSTGGL